MFHNNSNVMLCFLFGLIYLLGGLARNNLVYANDKYNCQVGHQGKHCDGELIFQLLPILIFLDTRAKINQLSNFSKFSHFLKNETKKSNFVVVLIFRMRSSISNAKSENSW